MPEPRIAAVLLVRPLKNSRKGTGPPFSEDDIMRLTEAMLLDALEAVAESRLVDDLIMVSPDSTLLSLADENGVKGILEQEGEGTGSALERGLSLADPRTTVAMLMPCLLPLLKCEDLAFLLGRSLNGPRVVLVPSMTTQGTSLLISNPPDIALTVLQEARSMPPYEAALTKSVPVESYRTEAGFDVRESSDLLHVLRSPRPSRAKDLLMTMRIEELSSRERR
ncbi:MAG: hypothetical protein LN412_06975 [Candidatus Thermoplasmatota archaeon]|nr:hypothetical protein [Candidatus Thermoplasmatota archaeon]